MVDAIRVEMTRDQLKHAIMVEDMFQKNFPGYDTEFAKAYLADLKSADAKLEITKIHEPSIREAMDKFKAYLEHHDHDLECTVRNSQLMYININNYWNGIGDGFGFYIEKQPWNDYLTITDDGWLHFEKEVFTPGIRYEDVLRSMAYSDIHQFEGEFVMLASMNFEPLFENIEKYKQFLIESYSAYYDKVETKGE